MTIDLYDRSKHFDLGVLLLDRTSFPRDIPKELRKAIKGLDHPNRQAIVVALEHNRSLSFTELTRLLKLSKGRLSHHLDILLDSALVRNFSKSEFKGPYDSYYALSNFGEAFIESLFSALRPEMKLQATWEITATVPAVVFPNLGGKVPRVETPTIQVT